MAEHQQHHRHETGNGQRGQQCALDQPLYIGDAVGSHQVGHHDLGGLGDGRAEHIGEHGEHIGVHPGVDDEDGKQIADGLDGHLGQVIGDGLSAGGDADAQQPPQLVGGEGAQQLEGEHRPELPAEENGDEDHSHHPGDVAGQGSARHAQGGQAEGSADEHRVAADVEQVHDHRYDHALLHHLIGAEKGGEGEVDRLEHHTAADDQQVEAAALQDLRRYLHHGEDGAAHGDENGPHRQAEDGVDQQGEGIGLVDPPFVLRPQIAGDEDGGGGGDDGKDQQHQVGDLVGVADSAHAVGVKMAHHDLVGIAYQHLEEQLNEDGPGEGQNTRLAPAEDGCLFHGGASFRYRNGK